MNLLLSDDIHVWRAPSAQIPDKGIVMTKLVGWLMASNAVLFFFGAVQHAGVVIGPFREPRILPATIVETLCGLALGWGAVAVFGPSVTKWRVALITNLVALAGVVLGVRAIAAGAGPRTASNDLYHVIMLVLIAASLVLLFATRSINSSALTR